jgi:hypothetical protein
MRSLFVLSLSLLAACGAPEAGEAPAPAPVPPTAEAPTTPRILVRDPRGAPAPGASIAVIDQGYSLRAGPLASGPDGAVGLDPIPDLEDPIVLAWAPGRAAARLELASLDGEHAIVLPDPTPLVGFVPDARGRVEHVWLQAIDPEAPWPYFVRCEVDAAGSFRADGLAAGRYAVYSVPIGSAPVLSADAAGRTTFLAVEPGRVPPTGHRFFDRDIDADGREHPIRAAFGVATIAGRVVDDHGTPVAGASIRVLDEDGRTVRAMTDPGGGFEIDVEPAPHVHVMAEHPSFGEQATDHEWDGWRYGGPIPDQPIELVLRRGVVLSGRVLRPGGRPLARALLLLVPAYVGSGPRPRETHTDADGRFELPRMVLRHFELVPERLENWHPFEPGRYLRVARPAPEEWVAAAAEGRPVEIALEPFELVRATIAVGSAERVEVWMRWGEPTWGSRPPVERGRVALTMERGRAHELWVSTFEEDAPMEAPWDRRAPDWTGTPDGPLELRLAPR